MSMPYFSVGEVPALKMPFLPTNPLRVTSWLNGSAYATVGQAATALHTMAMLQAYQADLLKDLDQGQGLPLEAVVELHCTTDLSLRLIG